MTDDERQHAEPLDRPGTKRFGWQGVTCRMPEDWDLSGVSGTPKAGYFSFDDERSRRLEIKYDRMKRWGQPALDKMLTYYFDSVRKKLKKGMAFETEENLKLVGLDRLPPHYEYRTYGWTSEFVARGIIWRCSVCRRVVIAQCLSAPNRVNLREMSDVLTSMRCHSDGDEQMWAAFDFATDVRSDMDLESSKLQAGLISLTFVGKNAMLVVDRLGMAHAVVKHTPLDRYVLTVHYKKLRRRRLRFVEEPWGGHPGYRMEGERKRLVHWIPWIGPKLRQWRTRDHIGGRVWHDEQANCLFIIRAEGKDAQSIADRVAASILRYQAADAVSEVP